MKSILLIICVFMTTSFFGSPPGLLMKDDLKSISVEESRVPPSVMARFEASFVYEDGFFRGAQVDMLRPYLNSAEIVDLVRRQINYPSSSLPKVAIYEGYKPIRGGCKQHEKYICVIADVEIIRG